MGSSDVDDAYARLSEAAVSADSLTAVVARRLAQRRRRQRGTAVVVAAVLVSGAGAGVALFEPGGKGPVANEGPLAAQPTSIAPAVDLAIVPSRGGGSEVIFGALITGLVEEDPDGCLFLRGSGADRTYLAWPEGFTGERDGGDVVVLAGGDTEVARTGEYLNGSGAYSTNESGYVDSACIPDGAQHAYVQSLS